MRPKYGNKKVTFNNKNFSSKLEAAVYLILKNREQDKEISDIKCQETVYLTNARIIYKPDFSFIDKTTKEKCFAEAKGFETNSWAIKLKLWRFYGPGRLYLYKGTHDRAFLHEEIIPQ